MVLSLPVCQRPRSCGHHDQLGLQALIWHVDEVDRFLFLLPILRIAVDDEAIPDHRFDEEAYGSFGLDLITPVRLVLLCGRVKLDSGVGGWWLVVGGSQSPF